MDIIQVKRITGAKAGERSSGVRGVLTTSQTSSSTPNRHHVIRAQKAASSGLPAIVAGYPRQQVRGERARDMEEFGYQRIARGEQPDVGAAGRDAQQQAAHAGIDILADFREVFLEAVAERLSQPFPRGPFGDKAAVSSEVGGAEQDHGQVSQRRRKERAIHAQIQSPRQGDDGDRPHRRTEEKNVASLENRLSPSNCSMAAKLRDEAGISRSVR